MRIISGELNYQEPVFFIRFKQAISEKAIDTSRVNQVYATTFRKEV